MTHSGDMTQTIPEWRIGHRLALARESAGLTVDQMAAILRVTRHTITNYEKHHGRKRGVPYAVLVVYASATNVPVEWLETGTAAATIRDTAAGYRLSAAA